MLRGRCRNGSGFTVCTVSVASSSPKGPFSNTFPVFLTSYRFITLFHQRTSHAPCVLLQIFPLVFLCISPHWLSLRRSASRMFRFDLLFLMRCGAFVCKHIDVHLFISFSFRGENSRVKLLPCKSSSANREPLRRPSAAWAAEDSDRGE